MSPTPWTLRGRSRAGSAEPGSLLRQHPILLLGGTPTDTAVRRLVQEWNPSAGTGIDAGDPGTHGSTDLSETPRTSGAFGTSEETGVEVAQGVRFAGPFRLDPETLVDAGLGSTWTTAYAALCVRDRVRVPDGIDADQMRLRYPHGLPVGVEGVAWSLVTGLARRLGGAMRLPADSLRATRSVTVRHVQAQDNVYCVYGHDALPWSVLRSVLCLSLPELDRNGALAPNDYCLDRPGSFEVRVRPFRADGFVPYALRPRAAADWPCTVYRFRCLPQATDFDAQRVDAQLRGAACQLADVVGGLVLDGEGFPLSAAFTAVR
ncbi:hypothetical protein KDL01_16895 [Actinospica durhamensis]|uniref:Uncharacterized protein n=1 Tax=Actinospica durhamensis TaxID=1508375 RepID=A0A941ETT6_9ACTN|nr:hypothetical protein [Actinospica durhamensis]MBR7834954.1 hypothetical protein [Actinospica durhamensis]